MPLISSLSCIAPTRFISTGSIDELRRIRAFRYSIAKRLLGLLKGSVIPKPRIFAAAAARAAANGAPDFNSSASADLNRGGSAAKNSAISFNFDRSGSSAPNTR